MSSQSNKHQFASFKSLFWHEQTPGSSDCCLLTKKHSQDSQALNEKHSAKPPESDSCFIVLAATFPNRVISLDFMIFLETVSAWNKIYRPWRASPCLPQLSGPSWHGFTPRLQRLLIDRIHHDSTIYAYPPLSARCMRRVHTAHTMFHLMFHTKNVPELVSPAFEDLEDLVLKDSKI